MGEYRQNHYVPQWYQKRFLAESGPDGKLFHRDLAPQIFRDAKGRSHQANEVSRRGPGTCFVKRDLYTLFLGPEPSTEVEQLFFGKVDAIGKRAIEAFSNFSVANALSECNALLSYMGAQKLRTPKGLGWVAAQTNSKNRDARLKLMMNNHAMYHAIWSECVWVIADADRSRTKFIMSDHPVTVYNRRCGPSSDWCRGFSDPDLVLAATHTIFPLSLDKVLLLTNLTWGRNPYQNPIAPRPNPRLSRVGLFKALSVQSERHLDEREVLEINFIIKSRALRYIAAGQQDWLFPEKHVSKSEWATFGSGYLLMPDPRALHMGGTVYGLYDDGRSFASDEYGRKPGEDGWGGGHGTTADESVALDRFKGEFARLVGPYRRGRVTEGPDLEPEFDSDDFHRYHLGLEGENRARMKGLRRW